jgi:hypothetical protein
VAPGSFKARLTAGGVTRSEAFSVKIDPRVAKDGVTAVDLAEQTKLALKVRDGVADARQLAQRVRQALDAGRGDKVKLQSLLDRLTTKSGPYEDAMFIDQLSNVGREIGQADQKVGASAYERFNDLMKEWTALKLEAEANYDKPVIEQYRAACPTWSGLRALHHGAADSGPPNAWEPPARGCSKPKGSPRSRRRARGWRRRSATRTAASSRRAR